MSRTAVLFTLLSVWFIVILLRLGCLASGMADTYRISSETVSGRSYPIKALRGSILSADGKVLVKSEKHYDLEIAGTLDEDEFELLQEKLPARNIPATISVGDEINSLTPQELIALEKMLRTSPALHVKVRIERVVIDSEEIRRLAGKTDPKTGHGVSGWEKEFDPLLRGRDGKLRVTRDSHGRWLKNTGEIETLPLPGQDIKVPYTLDGKMKK